MKQLFAFVFCLLLMVACKTYEKSETVTSEIIATEIVERDSVIYTPVAKSDIKIRVDSLAVVGHVEKTNRQATVKVVYKDNYIYADCTCDSLALEVTIQDRIIQELKTIVKTDTRIDKELIIPWLYKGLSGVGLLSLLVLILKRKKLWA